MIRELLSSLAPTDPVQLREALGRPDEAAASARGVTAGFVRPSLSYPPLPRRSAGNIVKISPRRTGRRIETALRPLFGLPILIVETGTVVRASRTGEECTVDDSHPAISDRRLFMTQRTYDRFKAWAAANTVELA